MFVVDILIVCNMIVTMKNSERKNDNKQIIETKIPTHFHLCSTHSFQTLIYIDDKSEPNRIKISYGWHNLCIQWKKKNHVSFNVQAQI